MKKSLKKGIFLSLFLPALLSCAHAYASDIQSRLPASNEPFILNSWMLCGLSALGLIMISVAVWIYRKETPAIVFDKESSFMPIGGWLILVLAGLTLTPFGFIKELVGGKYLNLVGWHTKLIGSKAILFRAALIYEAIGYAILAGYSIFCLVLLLNRRDILPKYIVGYYASLGGFFLIDYFFAISMGTPDISLPITVFRTVLFALIWIIYFKRSPRVENTFIVPFPSTNYSYEE